MPITASFLIVDLPLIITLCPIVTLSPIFIISPKEFIIQLS